MFIEKPGSGPDWIEKLFKMLKEECWEGKPFEDFRINCRGDIEIEKGDDWTAVTDQKKNRVFHNREMRKGSGKKQDIEEFRG